MRLSTFLQYCSLGDRRTHFSLTVRLKLARGQDHRNMKYILFICAGFLLLAVAELPYGYYTLLRLVVTIGAVLVVYNEYSKQLNFWVISFGIIALLFNPIFPIHLRDKELWAIIDVLCAIIFIVKGIKTKS